MLGLSASCIPLTADPFVDDCDIHATPRSPWGGPPTQTRTPIIKRSKNCGTNTLAKVGRLRASVSAIVQLRDVVSTGGSRNAASKYACSYADDSHHARRGWIKVLARQSLPSLNDMSHGGVAPSFQVSRCLDKRFFCRR